MDKDQGECCFFIPIRLGCGLIAMVAFCQGCFHSLVYFGNYSVYTSGGYNQRTKWWSVIVGSLGIGFGLMGLLGVYDNKLRWLQAFAYYEAFKVAFMIFVFYWDMQTMGGCEQWSYSMTSHLSTNGALEVLSDNLLCGAAWKAYKYGFSVDFGLQCYFAYVVWTFYSLMCAAPAYRIKFDNKWEPFMPSRLGEPSEYLRDREAEAKYNSMRGDLEEKLYTNAMGDKEFRGGYVEGSMAGTKEYGAVDRGSY